jgi:hypothetical protein
MYKAILIQFWHKGWNTLHLHENAQPSPVSSRGVVEAA